MRETREGKKEKIYRDVDVLEAARERIRFTFQEFDDIYLSVSGGKDSSVMLQLFREIAEKRGCSFDVLFIDLEAQYKATIRHLEELLTGSSHVVDDIYWICLPFSLRNSVSQIQPKWTCWNPDMEEKWVREKPSYPFVYTLDDHSFDFYNYNMEFEDFMVEFGKWYCRQKDGDTATGIAIRTDESFNRFTSLVSDVKEKHGGRYWTTQLRDGDVYYPNYKIYPIYDWSTEDIWGYISKKDLPYNQVYEQLYKNGVSIHRQRICQPFGDDQRKGLDQYRKIEPETWEKLLNRVSGVNFGNIYARTSLLGEFDSEKPSHLSWEEYAVFLLESIGLYCPELRDHYTEKITTFIEWYEDSCEEEGDNVPPGWSRGHGVEDFPDSHPDDWPNQKYPSWERIARAIERNDFWMKRLTFNQTKTGRKKLEDMEEKYGEALLEKEATTDKHLQEWKEERNQHD